MLKKLKELDLDGTDITKENLDIIFKLFPDIEIFHDLKQ